MAPKPLIWWPPGFVALFEDGKRMQKSFEPKVSVSWLHFIQKAIGKFVDVDQDLSGASTSQCTESGVNRAAWGSGFIRHEQPGTTIRKQKIFMCWWKTQFPMSFWSFRFRVQTAQQFPKQQLLGIPMGSRTFTVAIRARTGGAVVNTFNQLSWQQKKSVSSNLFIERLMGFHMFSWYKHLFWTFFALKHVSFWPHVMTSRKSWNGRHGSRYRGQSQWVQEPGN